LPEIFERGGNKAIEDAYIRHGYTMKEIAVYLEIHYATVTAARGSMKVEMFDCKT
jgi:DNA-binding CsgD family transcriptional regulator